MKLEETRPPISPMKASELELKLELNNARNEIVTYKKQCESEMKLARFNFEEKITSLKEETIKSNLILELTIEENKNLKSQIHGLASEKADVVKQLRAVEDELRSSKSQNELSSALCDKWESRFKHFQIKLEQIKEIEANLRDKSYEYIKQINGLKMMLQHNECVLEELYNEKNEMKEKMNQFKEKAEKLSSSKEVSDGQLKLLQEQVTELRKLNTKLKEELEKASHDKSELELKLIDYYKNEVSYNKNVETQVDSIKKLTRDLDEKTECLMRTEKEKEKIKTDLAELQIQFDVQISNAQIELKKKEIQLKNEMDEKEVYKARIEEFNEKIYLLQLDKQDLMNNLEKLKPNKTVDNFTQTLSILTHANFSNKMIQTEETKSPLMTTFTQTIEPFKQDVPKTESMVQTDSEMAHQESQESFFLDQQKSKPTKTNLVSSLKFPDKTDLRSDLSFFASLASDSDQTAKKHDTKESTFGGKYKLNREPSSSSGVVKNKKILYDSDLTDWTGILKDKSEPMESDSFFLPAKSQASKAVNQNKAPFKKVRFAK